MGGFDNTGTLTHHLESGHFLNTGQISVEGSLEIFHGALKRTIFFNGQQATINGTDVQALKVFNHTRQVLNFGPTLEGFIYELYYESPGFYGNIIEAYWASK